MTPVAPSGLGPPLELTVDTSAVLALAQARATPTPLTVDGATGRHPAFSLHT